MEPMAPHKFKIGDIVAFRLATRFVPSGVFEVITASFKRRLRKSTKLPSNQ
jgi:hypothetical protein